MNFEVISFGLISGLALVLGAWVGLYWQLPQKIVAAIMAFGSGVLVCALTFGLMEDAFRHGGFDAVILGFLSGGLVFILGDYLLHRLGARRYKKHPLAKPLNDKGGSLIVLGAILDGIPESVALGIALFVGQSQSWLMLVAIFLSNFPEGLASVKGLTQEKFSKYKILALWLVVAIFTMITTILSYWFLRHLDPNLIGALEAFAAGAILAMLSDSMMPEAYEEGGFLIGLATVLGFLLAFVISRV